MFLITQCDMPSASESSMVSLSGLIPCNTPGWRSLVSGPRHHRATRCICDFADRQTVSFQRRDGIQPPPIPRSLRWSLITASREAFCTCPKNGKAGNTAQNASLRKHQPGKIGLVIGKNTSHQFDIRALLSVRLLSHAWPNSLCPQLTVFYLAQYGGWQRAANRHLHVTPRANKIVL